MRIIKSTIKRLLPMRVRKLLGDRGDYCRSSYAQEGEDRILAEMFGLRLRKDPGFYVDVGAHHPERYSNTYLFYTFGWRGINIDAMPGSMDLFKRERPLDINLEAAISDEEKALTFYEFNEPALNGFNREIASSRDQFSNWKLVGQREIKTIRLDKLLESHLPKGRSIDFMSIDVEGLDFNVLKSNDWKKFRPVLVLVEDSEAMMNNQVRDTVISRFMRDNGYVFCCKTVLTTFFVDKDHIDFTPAGFRLKNIRATN